MIQRKTLLTKESLAELASANEPPCLSLYQPTHRHSPANQQDVIRFRNLVRELEKSLRQKYSDLETRNILEPLQALTLETDFWNHTLDGLAVLRGPSVFHVYRLQRPVPELAIVADSFHTKPLRRFLQTVGRFQVLGLSQSEIQLFEGNRNDLDEIELAPGVPRTSTEALGETLNKSHLTVSSYGGIGQGSTPMHHGHRGRQEAVKADTEKFFRAIDRAVLEHHSRPSGLPLILAALPEHHHLFQSVSHNQFLWPEGIDINPLDLPIDEFRARAWQVVEPRYQTQLVELADEFAVAKSKGLGSDDIAQAAQAASEGRVATLLIESGRQIAGRIDQTTGQVEPAVLNDPQIDDMLDDLGELVTKKDGRVLVIPADCMPSQTGLAATYRY